MNIIRKHSTYGSAHNTPKLIIVHAMGQNIATGEGVETLYAPDFLASQGISAHAMVDPDGTIIRCREDNEGAYHARGFNVDSLGIEVLVQGNHNYATFLKAIETKWITPEQYMATLEQCANWMKKYDIRRILRHSDVSPGRKVDPGAGFPWGAFIYDLKELYDVDAETT